MRLNLYIAKGGVVSRRGADRLIKEGKVRINGRIVREPFYRVTEKDSVTVKEKKVIFKENIYIIFHKPEGVITTLKDKFADKKIMDLLPARFEGVYPVGRLDKNSSGLIILTNDGQLCYALTHPKFEVEKEYLVRVRGKLSQDSCRRAEKGVVDEGDLLRVKKVKIIRASAERSLCKVVVSEGKKRHLRRLFKQLGLPVLQLKRVRIGNLRLGSLREAEYKIVEKERIYRNALGNLG
ncbi:MAG: rRNA pseudouridine synthase [Candidatus Omnitrophota bacterium]|nr:MAG: rRNA pseudouridine synthase [Candidatus Omnitrophota bacterium]